MSNTPDLPEGMPQGGPQQPGVPQQPEQPTEFSQQPEASQQPGAEQPHPQHPQHPQHAEHPQYAQHPQHAQHPQYAQPESTPQPGGGPPKKKGLSAGAIIGIIAGGLVALTLLIVAAIFIFRAVLGGGGLGGESPSAAVENYLTALSEGDAQAALVYIDPSEHGELLNDEVLQRSNEIAALSNITVGEAEQYSSDQYYVTAQYTLGDRQYEKQFDVWLSDEPQIISGLERLSLSSLSGLDVAVNGVAFAADSASIFPGGYELEVVTDGFELDGYDGPVTIGSPEDSEALYNLAPSPKEETVQTFRDLVAESLAACLESSALNTECGMDVTDFSQDGYSPIDGTVDRTLTAAGQATLDSLEARPNYEHPMLLEAIDSIDVDITFEAENGAERAQVELLFGAGLNKPSVNFADESPSVAWH